MERKYQEGYTYDEIHNILSDNEHINPDKFWDVLKGCTGIIVDGQSITFTDDVDLAVRCGLENREATTWEFD